MKETIIYRGYRLEVSTFGPGWKVLIYPPGSRLALPTTPNTREVHGRDAVIDEAEAAVDEDIFKVTDGPKASG